jgi:hypothetical protein
LLSFPLCSFVILLTRCSIMIFSPEAICRMIKSQSSSTDLESASSTSQWWWCFYSLYCKKLSIIGYFRWGTITEYFKIMTTRLDSLNPLGFKAFDPFFSSIATISLLVGSTYTSFSSTVSSTTSKQDNT